MTAIAACEGLDTCCSAAYMSRLEQQRFTVSEVATDRHELMIPWHIMRPSIARDGEQLDPRHSTQTYHCLNQCARPSALHPIARELLLISRPAEGIGG